MRRRDFITLIGGGVAVWPLAVRAQQSVMPVIGWLHSGSATGYANIMASVFRQGLNEAGFADGQNVSIEYRWAENQPDRLPTLSADLAHRQVSVIAACGSPASALAAKSASTSIPIVFETASDPVQIALVSSLSRPGGNLTGVTTVNGELETKRLGLLRELVPSATSIAVLVNPTRPDVDTQTAQLQKAGQAVGLALHILNASSERDFDAVFLNLAQLRAGALVIASDALFNDWSERLAALALRHEVPAVHHFRQFTAAGGLMSYGPKVSDSYRLAGIYAGRILKGEKPADLPVLQPTKFELVINIKTAKALNLTISPGVLAIADEVIE
jgi:putative tryptophan/tyrosine transport system substrate-binding protein